LLSRKCNAESYMEQPRQWPFNSFTG
jgi:hypothetical protein